MASFRDSVLAEFSDATKLGELLLPPSDTDRRAIRTALGATFDLAAARIERVQGATIREIVLEHPLFPLGRQRGTWEQTVPHYTRSELMLQVSAPDVPVWVDLLVRLDVTVVAEVDPAGAEAVLVSGFDDFTTLDEFRARFAFIDLDAFMAAHHLSTVEDLRDAFDYLVAEIRLRQPSPFDPNDPANVHTLHVTLAMIAIDPLDLTDGLRAARLVSRAAQGIVAKPPTSIPVEVIAPYSIAVIFSQAALTGSGFTAAMVRDLFAQVGVMTLFFSTN